MATIRGVITDQASGQPRRLHRACAVIERDVHPSGRRGCSRWDPAPRRSTAAGSFEVTVPTGGVRVLVERGTEYVPLERNLTVTETGTVDLELPLARWTHLAEQGWYPGEHPHPLRREGAAAR